MPNLITYIPKLQAGFEECRVLESQTAWMENNARPDMISWISPKKFTIQTLDVDGLGDYPANCDCFPTGGFSVENKTYELSFRRSKRLCWNRADDMDTDGIVTASNLLRIMRTRQVVPEVDRFRFSKLANYGIEAARVTTGKTYVDPATALADIRADLLKITEDGIWKNEDLVVLISTSLKDGVVNLATGGGSCCFVDAQGNLRQMVNSIDGVELKAVPPKMFRTKFIYNSGSDGEFGFKDDPAASDINWIICARTAPTAIVRYDSWKVFDPQSDDCADNWRLLYTMYHDLWVNACDIDSMWVNTK